MVQCQCQPLFVCLGVFLTVVGATCFGLSVMQAVLVTGKSRIHPVKGFEQVDVCNPKRDDNEVTAHWYVALCFGSSPGREKFDKYDYDRLCQCTRARTSAWAIMLIVSAAQVVVGLLYSLTGCMGLPSCCKLGRAWLVLCCILALLCVLSLISFVLAILFDMRAVEQNYLGQDVSDGDPITFFGTAFVAFCGIDFFLNFIGSIISCVGILRGDKNNDKDRPAPTQGQGQGQGQGSQSLAGPPPAYSKSQTNKSAKSASSSQKTNQRQ